ncbi:MAG: hypothetical protein HAW58_01510, partial [Candidatus Thioglobus sp.]|nr:hypothetical protein [Candidatus Thioglobus sp.]
MFKNSDYQRWRDEKLAAAAGKLSDCIVEIQNPLLLSSAEKNQIFALCKNANFALFQI